MEAAQSLPDSISELTVNNTMHQRTLTIRCVVVGDTGVGKTRLICARACGSYYTLKELMQTHVPSIWAIDHYRKDRQIMQNSYMAVDGLTGLSLQLWDTFGDHDKRRQFAYSSADVVLVCYSVANIRSLMNVKKFWYPEVTNYCNNTPIVLCGCKVDLRYLYNDPEFIKLDKGPFFKDISSTDLVSPEEGRNMAKSIRACYYETSSLTPFGIDNLFENVCRAALLGKRDRIMFGTLWGHLKKVQKPCSQQPFKPPKPNEPHCEAAPTERSTIFEPLIEFSLLTRVKFRVRDVYFEAHKTVLVVSSSYFRRIFLPSVNESSCRNSLLCSYKQHSAHIVDMSDTSKNDLYCASKSCCCVDCIELKLSSIGLSDDSGCDIMSDGSNLSDEDRKLPTKAGRKISGLSIESMLLLKKNLHDSELACHKINPIVNIEELPSSTDKSLMQTVMTLDSSIDPAIFSVIINFLYTGRFTSNNIDVLAVISVAHMFELEDLVEMVCNSVNDEAFLNIAVERRINDYRIDVITRLFLDSNLLSDVVFHLDDGTMEGHKVLLSNRCDVLASMFSYNFREHDAPVVSFPGISCEVFGKLQRFLYTRQLKLDNSSANNLLAVGNSSYSLEMKINQKEMMKEKSILDSLSESVELLTLADQLCLQDLVSLIEQHIVTLLQTNLSDGVDIIPEVLILWDIADLHNAKQLAAWCRWFLCTNYLELYENHQKLLQKLKPERQIFLNHNRWPPLWYIKENEYYERCVLDEQRELCMKSAGYRKSVSDISSSKVGCLGKSHKLRRFNFDK